MGNVNSHIQVPNAILKQFRDEEDPEKKVWYLDLAKKVVGVEIVEEANWERKKGIIQRALSGFGVRPLNHLSLH